MRQQRLGGRRAITLFAVLGLTATACSGGSDDSSPEDTASAAAEETSTDEVTDDPEADGGGGVVRIGMNLLRQQSVSMDPRVMTSSNHGEFLNQLYSPLAEYDPQTGEYSPHLAEFEVVDPQTMRFTIREDATFHDGNPVTAGDAKASIEATKANTEEGTCTCNGGIALVESVDVEDDRTFVVNASGPALATLFELMVGPEFMISPADAGSAQTTEPVGNGPFQFAQYEEGQRIVLEKYEDHWTADEVRPDTLEFINLEPGNTQVNALLAGDIDFAEELDLSGFQTLEQRDGVSGISAVSDFEFIYLRPCKSDDSPWGSAELRQAFMAGVDREALNAALYDGQAVMTAAMFPPGHPNYDPSLDEIVPHDPDRARQLIEDAGFAGETIDMWVNTASVAESQDLLLLLDQQMSELGLSFNGVATDDVVGDFLRPAIEAPETLDVFAIAGLHTRPGLQKLTRHYQVGEITNPCNLQVDRMDEILAELQGLAPDDPRARELWLEAQRINIENAHYPVFGFYPSFNGVSDNIEGVDPDSFASPITGGIPFERMTVSR